MKVNYDLSKILKPYKKGWVAMNKQQTKVIAHADTFTKINEKFDNPDEVVLFPLGGTQTYFVGHLNG